MVDLSGLPQRKPIQQKKSRPSIADVVQSSIAAEAGANFIDDSVSPVDARQSYKLGRELGYDPATVSADVKGFAEEAELTRAREKMEVDPRLTSWFTDALRVSASRDDVDNLAAISEFFGTTRKGSLDNGPLGRRYINRMKGSTASPYELLKPRDRTKFLTSGGRGQAISATPAPVGPRAATPSNVAQGIFSGIEGGLRRGAFGAERATVGLLDDLTGNRGLETWYQETDYFRETTQAIERSDEISNVRYEPVGKIGGVEINPGQFAYQSAISLGQLGAALVTGQPLATIGVVSGGDQYLRARERGASNKQATASAVATGAIEILTEKLPLDYLVGAFGKTGTGKLIGGMLAREIPSEVAATVGQQYVDAMSYGGKGFEQFKTDLPQDVVDTIGATVFMGGGIGAINSIARRLSPEVRAMDDIAQATAGAAFVDQLMATAEQSKLRTEDPETFREFIEHQTADAPVRDLYVPVEAINEYMQSEGYETGPLDAYAEQIAEAQSTQGDVVIPLAEAAAHLAGTPAWEAIKDKARLQPGGLSQKEALEQHAEIMSVLEQRGAEIAEEVTADDAVKSDAADVYVDVKNRLLAGGVDSKVAEQTAQIVAARYETQGKRRGTTATEAWKKSGVVFDWETKGKVKGRKLAQSATVNIGLAVNDGSKLSVQEVVEALGKVGVSIKGSRVTQSATEPTFVAELDRALTPKEATALSVALRQDAIAQRAGDDGALFGPAAEKWGPFNPDFFIDLRTLNQSILANFDTPAEQALAAGSATLDGGNGQAAYMMIKGGRDQATRRPEATPRQEVDAQDVAKEPAGGPAGEAAPPRDGQLELFPGADFGVDPTIYGDEIEVDGVLRPTTNADGELIAQTRQAVENFWRWFGDSKAVNDDGHPIVFYHGSKSPQFDKFGRGGAFETFFFSIDKRTAEGFQSNVGGAFISAYLRIDRVDGYDAEDRMWTEVVEGEHAQDDIDEATDRYVVDQMDGWEASGEVVPVSEDGEGRWKVNHPAAAEGDVYDSEDEAMELLDALRETEREEREQEIRDDTPWWELESEGYLSREGLDTSTDQLAEAAYINYDAVWIDNVDEGSGSTTVVIVLGNPADIKSVDNYGAFDPDDARMLYQSDVVHNAGWTPERLSAYIDRYDGNAMVTLMRPEDFLNLNASQRGVEIIDERVNTLPEYEGGVLDFDRLAMSDPISINVTYYGERAGYGIKGHSGRHRMAMLRAAGINQVPVLVTFDDSGKRLPATGRENVEIGPNRSRSDQTANGSIRLALDGVPLNWQNKDRLDDLMHTAREMFQSEPQPVFFSALARALEANQTKRATGSQWAATLRKLPGIKQEELEWTGLLEYLEATEGLIDRDRLIELVEAGGIQVEEVVLRPEQANTEGRTATEIMEAGDADNWDDANALADQEAGVLGLTQFSSWSSDPSNDTYRELLITLPVGVRGNPTRAPSTHWDTEGVVAHVRYMDKVDADGKRVLFVEEVQSDWHQKGRDQGYATPTPPEEMQRLRDSLENAKRNSQAADDAIKEEVERIFALMRLNTEFSDVVEPMIAGASVDFEAPQLWKRQKAYEDALRMLGQVNKKYQENISTLIELRDRAQLAQTEADQAVVNAATPGIPNAPFKSSWPALVMKRVIRLAAEGGYDRVAWTTGEEQAERYNLSQAVGTLTLEGMHDSEGYRVRMQGSAALALEENSLGQVVERMRDESTLRMTENQMREAFGNDIATRLLASDGEPLGGEGLRIGGEGMKAFYDRNLVNITNDLIKRYGAKVGPVVLPKSAMDVSPRMREAYGEPAPTPNPGFDVTDKMRDAAMQGFTLFQGKARGSTTFLSDGRRLVKLFETANESTLIHEFGHIWLEEMRADALSDGATDQEKADWESLKKWWTKLGITVTDTSDIPEAAHEYFARTYERYFREGRPPVRSLRAAFKSFSGWLTTIYKSVLQMNAPINNTLREIFDRMIATEEAIDAYRRQENVGGLFNNAEEAGMTEAEFAAYQRLIGNARDSAYDELLDKTMAAIRAKRRADMREQRGNVRANVAAEINATPEFLALHLLRTGRWLGDPDRERVNVKLNTGWLIDTFGEDVLDQLPKGLPITRGDGQEGDVVAEMVGAPSGRALVEALVGMRVASEALRSAGETRSLRDKMIDDEVDRIMAERHGDVLDDGSIEEEAIAALNTAAQGEVIAAEIAQLGKRVTVKRPQTPYQFAREWARRKIMADRVVDAVSRSALQRYVRATAKAARAAEKAILEGNTDEAYRQKQAQLLNHALLAEGKKAADEIDTIVARMKRLADRAAMKSVAQDYLDKIHQLLEAYDFRPRSQRSLDEQEGFQQWAERQRAQGFEVHIPPRLENRGDPYSRVSVEELMSLNDLVQSLLHLGRTKQKLKVAQQERDFNEFVDEVVARVEQLPQRKLPAKPINEDSRMLADAASELIKIETLVEELDGGVTGPLHDAIVLGATTAENRRNTLRQQVLMPIVRAYHEMGRRQRKRLNEKVTLSELTWNSLREGDPRQGQPVTITHGELLSIALNMGNLSNLEKLSKGERWPVATLQAIVDRELTKEDWDFVQLLWRQVNSLWSDIVEVEREVAGVVPEKVVPVPIQTRFGEYEGGYWPVVYDAARWQRAEQLEDAKLDDMFGIASGVATQKGHTISRTAAFGPFQLSLESVLFQHLEQVVTRVAFTAYARDVLRIIQHPRISGIIDTKLGPEYRRQIKPWLGRQINEGAVNDKAARWWGKVLNHARINMTVAAMGFRFSTGIAQTLGLTASAQRIGALNLAKGLKQLATNPRRAAEFAFSRSPELVNRTAAANREISEVFSKLRGKHSMLSEAQAWAFWHIGMIDRYVVALPTWLGAHQKGVAEGMTDAEASAYADKSVRLSQGAGSAKDLSRIQGDHNPAMRFFTMFYSPFNVMFNAQWQGVRGLKKGKLGPMIGVTFWWMIASTLADALLAGDWPDDEEGYASWFGRNVFFGAFAGIPLIRDGATYIERKMIGEFADFGTTPISRIGDAIEKTYKMGRDAIVDGEAPERPIKQTADVTAILTGVPVSQAGTSGQFLWDYSEGEADPQSISDWYFGVTRGKVPSEKE